MTPTSSQTGTPAETPIQTGTPTQTPSLTPSATTARCGVINDGLGFENSDGVLNRDVWAVSPADSTPDNPADDLVSVVEFGQILRRTFYPPPPPSGQSNQWMLRLVADAAGVPTTVSTRVTNDNITALTVTFDYLFYVRDVPWIGNDDFEMLSISLVSGSVFQQTVVRRSVSDVSAVGYAATNNGQFTRVSVFVPAGAPHDLPV